MLSPCRPMRVYLNGREAASQADDEGSIPFTRSFLSEIKQQIPDRKDSVRTHVLHSALIARSTGQVRIERGIFDLCFLAQVPALNPEVFDQPDHRQPTDSGHFQDRARPAPAYRNPVWHRDLPPRPCTRWFWKPRHVVPPLHC